MSEFKHVVLTRYNWDNATQDFYKTHPNPKEWMVNRYDLFKATRESVLSQGVEFDWIISFDKNTPPSYIKKVCSAPNMYPVINDVRDLVFDYEEPFLITTRIDNDDLYLSGALRAIQEAFEPKIMVIDIDYYQLDIETRKMYTSERDAPTSPFLSLVEPKETVKTVYCRPHSYLSSGYPFVDGKKQIPAKKLGVFALQVLHGENLANKIVGREL